MSSASPEEPHSAPTLSAVAKLAGVSSITVSRVVRLPTLVAPETRGRVEAAMRELGYVPNQLAVALARARTRSIGVLVPTIANSIFADTVQGLSDELEPLGYAVHAVERPLDERFPEWGESRYFTVELEGELRLREPAHALYRLGEPLQRVVEGLYDMLARHRHLPVSRTGR